MARVQVLGLPGLMDTRNGTKLTLDCSILRRWVVYKICMENNEIEWMSMPGDPRTWRALRGT